MDKFKSATRLDREALRKLRMIKHAIGSDQSIVDYLRSSNSSNISILLSSYFELIKNNYKNGRFVDLDVDTINLLSWIIYDPDLNLILPELEIRKLAYDFRLILQYNQCVNRVYQLINELENSFSEKTLKKIQSEIYMCVNGSGLIDMECELHVIFVQNLLRFLNKKLKHDSFIIKAINDQIQVENLELNKVNF